MKKVVYYSQTDAVAELNSLYIRYDGLVAEYNELLRVVKLFMALQSKIQRIQSARLARIEALEEENERLWWAAQHALAWKRENEHLWLLLEADE